MATVKVKGLNRTVSRLKRRKFLVRDNGSRALLNAAEEMAFTASLMAPRESGTLESSIKVDDIEENGSRISADIYVDGSLVNPSGRSLAKYALPVHDQVEPAGGKELGAISEAKQLSTDEIVGGGFMSRAFVEQRDQARTGIIASIRKALRL